LEKPTYIVDQFFKPSVDAILNTSTPVAGEDRAHVFYQFAVFAEQQYYTLVRSPDVKRRKIYIDRKAEDIKNLERQVKAKMGTSAQQRELQKELISASKLKDADEALYHQYLREQQSFLLRAVEMYSLSLSSADSYDGNASIHLLSLWLANFDEPSLENTEFASVIEEALIRVPSHKFVFLAVSVPCL
jgi:serine-protein kinase ATM